MSGLTLQIMSADDITRYFTPQGEVEQKLFDTIKGLVENKDQDITDLEDERDNFETTCGDLKYEVEKLQEKLEAETDRLTELIEEAHLDRDDYKAQVENLVSQLEALKELA